LLATVETSTIIATAVVTPGSLGLTLAIIESKIAAVNLGLFKGRGFYAAPPAIRSSIVPRHGSGCLVVSLLV
jgi:hypothetical protein